MLIDGKTVEITTTLKFRSINNYDANLWVGEVIGFGMYSIAKLHTDVDMYHLNVLKDNKAQFQTGTGSYLQAPDLQYFLVKCTDGIIRAFAIEWVKPGTLEIIDPSLTSRTIKFYNLTSDSFTNLQNLLSDNDFVYRII